MFTRPACRTVAEFVGIVNVFPRPEADPAQCPVVSRLYSSPAQALDGRCVCIRPDQIHVSRNGASSCDFALPGVVRQVRWMGPIHEVTLDVGVPLIATISRQEQEALRLLPGDRVHVNMPGGAFHMLDST